jgi:penicillin-binding protein 2
VISVPLLGRDPARRDRPIRTGRRDKPIIQLPSIALRVAIVLGIAVVMFGIVFFRLWFLQILSGQEFVAQANDNRLKSVKIVAQRGNIVDRHGDEIVTTRGGQYVGIRLMDVPAGQLDQELAQLAPHLRMKPGEMRKRIMDYLRPSTFELKDGKWVSFLTWSGVVKKEITGVDLIPLKEDVSKRMRTYVEEHTLSYPGVEVQDEYLRAYPHGDLAAHILGHVGPISAEELASQHFKGYEGGDVVGQDGLEWTYDKWLRGRDGVAKVEVDAQGHPKRNDSVPGGRMAEAGDTLVTTIDNKVQSAAEAALRTGISLAHSDGQYAANGGAAVVLDVQNGDVLGMASYPTYDPSVWVGGISTKKYKRLFVKKSNNYPLLDRAIMESKAVGSTFKAVTAVAGLEEGVITPGTTEWCPGSYSSPNDHADPPQKFKCWATDGHGNLDLVGAITQSCDVYFYNVGNAFFNKDGTPLEDWATRFGMGKPNGIDIPGESAGRVPTPDWKDKYFETEIDRIWKPGDSILLAVGQGNLEATPLQLATAYAAIANGGKVVTPHLGLKVVDAAGQTVRDLEPKTSRKVDISQTTLEVVRHGLYEAAHNPAGTSAPVFSGYKVAVAGKTGTAEVWDDTSKHYVDYAWYASYAPADDPRYAVVVMIERGGHGASTAAPATRMIYDALFNVDSGAFSGNVTGD